MSDRQINLIARNIGGLRQLTNIESTLRRVAWWALGIVFVASCTAAASYLYARVRVQQLDGVKARVIRDINAQSIKEGLMLSLKERTTIAGRALGAAKPWCTLFTTLASVAAEDVFRTISVEDTGRVTASVELPSVDEAVAMMAHIMTLAQERKLRSPQMISFAFRETGEVQITMSFHPIF